PVNRHLHSFPTRRSSDLEVGVLYATAVMTAMVVIFAEVLPKTIAINAPDRVALLVARPMKVMLYLLGPLLTIIEAIVRLLMKALDRKSTRLNSSHVAISY